jgi:hypothetical protein
MRACTLLFLRELFSQKKHKKNDLEPGHWQASASFSVKPRDAAHQRGKEDRRKKKELKTKPQSLKQSAPQTVLWITLKNGLGGWGGPHPWLGQILSPRGSWLIRNLADLIFHLADLIFLARRSRAFMHWRAWGVTRIFTLATPSTFVRFSLVSPARLKTNDIIRLCLPGAPRHFLKKLTHFSSCRSHF